MNELSPEEKRPTGNGLAPRDRSPASPKVSVVLATYNRGPILVRLLRQLAAQDFPAEDMEVVVVDDGSREPAAPVLEALRPELPYRLLVLTQVNAGAAAARQRAVMHASGDLLVILDDDMQVRPDFISEHARIHQDTPGGHACVIGRYASDPGISSMPLFERYYANMWDKLSASVRRGALAVHGTMLSTGNASMRRDDFLAVGGFDVSLKQDEDADLGLKLERIGVTMVFSESAFVLHGSDHTDLGRWLRRNHNYGIYDSRLAIKHDWAAHADPWRYCFQLPKAGLPFVATSLVSPGLSKIVSGVVWKTATAMDRLGMEKLALRGAGVVFGMEYFRGVREEAGSLRRTIGAFRAFLRKTRRDEASKGAGP
ncbi:MAG TPA: glycosyltransferase [Polyangiaceae bacterium]|jgi:GT2 family glycosyltransferase